MNKKYFLSHTHTLKTRFSSMHTSETPLNLVRFNGVFIKYFLSYYTLIFIVVYGFKWYNLLNNIFFILNKREVF